MSRCSALFLPLMLILQILQGKAILELEETSIFTLIGLLLQSRQKNPKKSYTQKKSKHESSGWTILTRCSFDEEENKHDHYRGKECAMKIIN